MKRHSNRRAFSTILLGKSCLPLGLFLASLTVIPIGPVALVARWV